MPVFNKHSRSLDFLIVAAHRYAAGDVKAVATALEQASTSPDFKSTVVALSKMNGLALATQKVTSGRREELTAMLEEIAKKKDKKKKEMPDFLKKKKAKASAEDESEEEQEDKEGEEESAVGDEDEDLDLTDLHVDDNDDETAAPGDDLGIGMPHDEGDQALELPVAESDADEQDPITEDFEDDGVPADPAEMSTTEARTRANLAALNRIARDSQEAAKKKKVVKKVAKKPAKK